MVSGRTDSTSLLVITTFEAIVYRADMSRSSVSPITIIQRAHRLFSRPPVYNAGNNAMHTRKRTHTHTHKTLAYTKACKVATLPSTSGISQAPRSAICKCER